MNPIMSLNCIENIYAGPRGFYDVVGSSKRLKGIEEISEKKLTNIEAINVDEIHVDNHN